MNKTAKTRYKKWIDESVDNIEKNRRVTALRNNAPKDKGITPTFAEKAFGVKPDVQLKQSKDPIKNYFNTNIDPLARKLSKGDAIKKTTQLKNSYNKKLSNSKSGALGIATLGVLAGNGLYHAGKDISNARKEKHSKDIEKQAGYKGGLVSDFYLGAALANGVSSKKYKESKRNLEMAKTRLDYLSGKGVKLSESDIEKAIKVRTNAKPIKTALGAMDIATKASKAKMIGSRVGLGLVGVSAAKHMKELKEDIDKKRNKTM